MKKCCDDDIPIFDKLASDEIEGHNEEDEALALVIMNTFLPQLHLRKIVMKL